MPLGNRTEIAPVLSDLARVLMRIHADRAIAIETDCPPGLYFRGERQDLEEMAGNLIDNACKMGACDGCGCEAEGGRIAAGFDR